MTRGREVRPWWDEHLYDKAAPIPVPCGETCALRPVPFWRVRHHLGSVMRWLGSWLRVHGSAVDPRTDSCPGCHAEVGCLLF